MSLFAIGDLHLSFGVNKPMNIFGENWDNHFEKIQQNWIEKVSSEDTILLPGDISWGMKLEEAKKDLDFIDSLPGKKVIISGNHDYWWASAGKLNSMYENIFFLKNNFYEYGEYAICGSRGWICPNDINFTEHDNKMYKREQIRLKLSLDMAVNKGYKKIIVMIHYPPSSQYSKESAFIDILKSYGVIVVVYGHLHGKDSFIGNIEGEVDGIQYHLVSADYINFSLKKIL